MPGTLLLQWASLSLSQPTRRRKRGARKAGRDEKGSTSPTQTPSSAPSCFARYRFWSTPSVDSPVLKEGVTPTGFLLSKTGDLVQQGFRISHVLALFVLQSFPAEFSLVLLTCDYCYALLSIADMLIGTVAAAAVAAAIVSIAASRY